MNKFTQPFSEIPNDEILIRGKRIPVINVEVPLHKLKFYLENPRLYTLVRKEGNEPTEAEIEEKLLAMEHVKQLVQSIQINGGLIDPVIVRRCDMVVLEGNSRLAAYRSLAKKDPIRWGNIKVKILPETVIESDIFALLGEYHIHGKSNWIPFEQAGYLYRRHTNQGIPIATLAKEINLPKGQVNHLIDVHEFMLKHHEYETARWSYYDEYLKGRIIGKVRLDYPEMDSVVVKKIQANEIPTAMDLREGLKNICQAGGKTLNRFIEEKIDFDQARDAADRKGVSDVMVRTLSKFRIWLLDNDTVEDIVGQPNRKPNFKYELEHIQKQCAKILKQLDRI